MMIKLSFNNFKLNGFFKMNYLFIRRRLSSGGDTVWGGNGAFGYGFGNGFGNQTDSLFGDNGCPVSGPATVTWSNAFGVETTILLNKQEVE